MAFLNNTLGETDAATVAAKQKVTDLRGAYQQLNQTTTDLDGTFEQVYGQLQPLTTRMGEAEDRLYELALAGKQATQEYKDLMDATQNYLRTQMQVDLQVEAGAMPMAQKLTMAVGGVAGAFGAAEGAIALFGVESNQDRNLAAIRREVDAPCVAVGTLRRREVVHPIRTGVYDVADGRNAASHQKGCTRCATVVADA